MRYAKQYAPRKIYTYKLKLSNYFLFRKKQIDFLITYKSAANNFRWQHSNAGVLYLTAATLLKLTD